MTLCLYTGKTNVFFHWHTFYRTLESNDKTETKWFLLLNTNMNTSMFQHSKKKNPLKKKKSTLLCWHEKNTS